jgi:hypothetical protein
LVAIAAKRLQRALAQTGRPVEDVGNVGQALADEELDRLYGLPLGEFTAARDALAKELRGAGDAERAKRVKELRKPTRSAGAINRVVRARRKEARELLDAAEGLREAQARMLGGGDREAVDEAAERERARAEEQLVAARRERQEAERHEARARAAEQEAQRRVAEADEHASRAAEQRDRSERIDPYR